MEPHQPELEESCIATMNGVLKPVEAPSDEVCAICLDQEEAMTAWKETVCGHIFHGRCVERWLEMKGSCPMCWRQLQEPPVVVKQNVGFPNPFVMLAIESMQRDPHIFPDPYAYFPMYRPGMSGGD
ncbi:hypothetical protein VPH35_043469 [Triticum aestivum]